MVWVLVGVLGVVSFVSDASSVVGGVGLSASGGFLMLFSVVTACAVSH